MAQTNLRSLMMWHYHAKSRPCHDVPVMAILKVFREMAGPKGRKEHRLFPPAKYEYEAKRSSVGESSEGEGSLPPRIEELR